MILDKRGNVIKEGQSVIFDAEMIGGVKVVEGLVTGVDSNTLDPRQPAVTVIYVTALFAVRIPAQATQIPGFWVVGEANPEASKPTLIVKH